MRVVLSILKLIIVLILQVECLFATPYKQYEKIYLYGEHGQHFETVETALRAFNVDYEVIKTLSPHSKRLHIIVDALGINKSMLPSKYIVYQTHDLNNTRLAYQIKQLEHEYIKTLKGAIAVWDYDRKNIQSYSAIVPHYYYFPRSYEYTDPVILPCFLPSAILSTYKELLAYSNQVDTEISSLIPMLFFHSYVENPKLLMEAGVCFGYSTQAFVKASDLCGTELIGIDFSQGAASSYDCVQNGIFVCMDDTLFPSYFNKSQFKNRLLDVVFIDTSHEYQHTLKELDAFLPLLAPRGTLMFHDANVTPLTVSGRQAWWRINDTTQLMGPLSPPNPRGVAPALREFFKISFDETKYINTEFESRGGSWHMVHYPFCNGLTVIKRLK